VGFGNWVLISGLACGTILLLLKGLYLLGQPPVSTLGITEHMDMQWLNQARCLNEDPELFFPVGNTGPALEQIEQAKTICRQCKVSAQCLEYAIKENQDTGVWGGLSEDERRSLKRRYARARRAS
jgi:WhiB family redox-sensing transcriptional regulator